MNDKIFIFGHRKPDTDSVCSSISLSYLKNKLGFRTEARVLGNINKESKYALEYFNVSEPKYLNDVKLQLKDIDYHKEFVLGETESIYDSYNSMLKESLTGIPIVDGNKKFVGLITMKDLIYAFINHKDNVVDTSYKNLLKVLNGEEVVRIDEEISGDVIVASYHTSTFIDKVSLNSNQILIVGDRGEIIDYAIKSHIKMIIISNGLKIKEEYINMARNNNVNIIISPYDTFHISKIVTLSNYIKTMIRSYNTTTLDQTDYVDSFLDINKKLRHTNYPIIDRDDNCLGLLRITDLNSKHPKKVILVDHNEKLQTVDGIDEAEIMEIIDHHNLGSITTNTPVNFRNMSVGSTCTIVYTMYKEKNIEIPKDMAGMMLSGILSDTLILKSPTATDIDREAVEELSKIAEVDYIEYGTNLLKAGTSLVGMSEEDVLYNDYKLYNIGENHFAIGQFFTMNFADIEKNIDSYIKLLDNVAEVNNFMLVALYVTDIIKGGSYVIYNTKGESLLAMAYDELDVKEGMFIENCLSRKKNVIPVIMDAIER